MDSLKAFKTDSLKAFKKKNLRRFNATTKNDQEDQDYDSDHQSISSESSLQFVS